jgi:hypothetical protein
MTPDGGVSVRGERTVKGVWGKEMRRSATTFHCVLQLNVTIVPVTTPCVQAMSELFP